MSMHLLPTTFGHWLMPLFRWACIHCLRPSVIGWFSFTVEHTSTANDLRSRGHRRNVRLWWTFRPVSSTAVKGCNFWFTHELQPYYFVIIYYYFGIIQYNLVWFMAQLRHTRGSLLLVKEFQSISGREWYPECSVTSPDSREDWTVPPDFKECDQSGQLLLSGKAGAGYRRFLFWPLKNYPRPESLDQRTDAENEKTTKPKIRNRTWLCQITLLIFGINYPNCSEDIQFLQQ